MGPGFGTSAGAFFSPDWRLATLLACRAEIRPRAAACGDGAKDDANGDKQ